MNAGSGERAGALGAENPGSAGTALVCLWIAGCALFCVVKIMWPAYKDVEDKSVVKVYTMEELYGEDWERESEAMRAGNESGQ